MRHIPVLTKEVIVYLAPKKNENFIDATLGLAGHAKEILKKTAPNGRLLGIEQDIEALDEAEKNFGKLFKRVDLAHDNFSNLGLIIRSWKKEVNGILFDLGISSLQLDSTKRGFSFNKEAILDMRMSPERQRLTACDIVNSWDKQRLGKIFYQYGEDPSGGKIAQEIIRQRQKMPIKTTTQLVKVIEKAIPAKFRFKKETHFATSTFRALRMAVNNELENLEQGLKQAIQILSPKGRIVVISFHSLEDRIVKRIFQNNNNLDILTLKPITPTKEEIMLNPRSRSAKLRAAIKKSEIRNPKFETNLK